jgi:hypothetical protein
VKDVFLPLQNILTDPASSAALAIISSSTELMDTSPWMLRVMSSKAFNNRTCKQMSEMDYIYSSFSLYNAAGHVVKGLF